MTTSNRHMEGFSRISHGLSQASPSPFILHIITESSATRCCFISYQVCTIQLLKTFSSTGKMEPIYRKECPELAQAPTEHVITLSSLDQSLMRSYVRICLCFEAQDVDFSLFELNLSTFFRSKLRLMPYLAGRVVPIQGHEWRGSLELRYTQEEVDLWRPITTHLSEDDFAHSYESLSSAGMPPGAFIGNVLNPLPDSPPEVEAPVFCVQANFIDGGLLLNLYLHHSVSDGTGLGLLIHGLPEKIDERDYADFDLSAIAETESQCRRVLSLTHSARPNLSLHPEWSANRHESHSKQLSVSPVTESRMLSFSLPKLDRLKRSLSQELDVENPLHSRYLSTNDCFTALIWTGISRARMPRSDPSNTASTLAMPVSIRDAIKPPLPADYFGNACILKLISLSMHELLADVNNTAAMCFVASAIRRGVLEVDDDSVRSAIATINSSDDVRDTNQAGLDLTTDLVVTSLATLPINASDLGLGLGNAQWVRKTSTTAQGPGCIVLPKRLDDGVWEVMMQLDPADMACLLLDEGFSAYVERVTE